MTPITDISRFLKNEDVTETVTITAPSTIRFGCTTRSYYTGRTDNGEKVAVYVSGNSLLFNCLNAPRLAHRPALRLIGCSDRGSRSAPEFPSWFPLRVIYCEDAEFADAERKLAFDLLRGSFLVGARMDAILEGGEALQFINATQRKAATA